MHLRVVGRDRLNVVLPSGFFACVSLDVLSLYVLLLCGTRSLGKERLLGATKRSESSSMRLREVFRRMMCPKERDLRMNIHCAFNLAHDLEFVAGLLLKNKRSIVLWASKPGIISHRTATLLCKGLKPRGTVLAVAVNRALLSCDSSYWGFWRVLAEKLRICHWRVVESGGVVFWDVEKLTVGRVQLCIVFRALDVEVGYPAKFAIYVSFLGQLCVVWHAGTLHFIFFIGVQLSLWKNHSPVCRSGGLVKVFLARYVSGYKKGTYLVVSVVFIVPNTRCYVMAPVPDRVKQAGIVSVVQNNLIFSDLESWTILVIATR